MVNGMISNKIMKNINDNALLYFIASICVCVGIVLGIYCVKYLTPAENETMIGYVDVILKNVDSENVNHKALFIQAIKNNGLFILSYCILGFTIVGVPIIFILNIIKGFTLGFSFSFFIAKFLEKGSFIAIFSVLPQNLIYIPTIIIGSVLAIRYSIKLIKSRSNYKDNPFTTKEYIKNFIGLICVIFIGAILESFLNPMIIKLIIK